jgi:DnaJ-class molecular chaperone
MLFNPKKDYYAILGLTDYATTPEVLKKAFRTKALQHHPDKGGDAEKFKELNEAYTVLNDGYLKRAYDASRPQREVVQHGGIVFSNNGTFATTSTTYSQWESIKKYGNGVNW